MCWEGVGLLHSVTVCHTTSEIFFNLRVHSGDIHYEDHGQMPCVDMSTLSKKVEVMNVADTWTSFPPTPSGLVARKFRASSEALFKAN